ncbi:MAG: hypothetical protein IT181_11225 [Acidobacteria bacterium]|nr:hypothetical protein [Acidobacteriota bacterium]
MHRIVPAGLLAASLLGCGPRVPPLADTSASADILARALLAALAAGDRPTLERLALSESEFRDHVWPQLPAARPERNLPYSYVWGDLHQKSDASLSNTLAARRGHAAELVRVRFGDVTRYPTYAVHRDAVLVVRGALGTTEELRVCGSFLEQDGRWKVFSYVTDD